MGFGKQSISFALNVRGSLIVGGGLAIVVALAVITAATVRLRVV